MNKGFAIFEENGIKFLRIPAFTETGLVRHGFSTRIGGVSQPPYAELNLAAHVGDNLEQVLENRLRCSVALGINPRQWVTAKQVHGDRVYRASAGDRGCGAGDYESSLDCLDALITNEPGVPLATFYADCVPVFILDPISPAIGLAHAGWKGTVAKLPQKTLLAMTKEFGTCAENCLIGIGPSIGPCCYEVEENVLSRFREAFPYGPELAAEGKNPGKWLLNLWEANRRQLLDLGVRPEGITVAEICTNCHPKTFFSYRAEKAICGRMGALIMLG